MKRIYHRWEKWECFKAGFWSCKSKLKKEEKINAVISFFSDEDGLEFDKTCNYLIYVWPYSCQHNLTNLDMNRIAWLGQASVASSLGISHGVTMEAWSFLTDEVKKNANEIALKYLKEWEVCCGSEEILK